MSSRNSNRTAAARGQRITLALDDGPLMTGDEDQVRQVVENVVGNAVKFADPDSTIDVACHHGPGGWSITVTNVGPSIDPTDSDRMFEPFVRVGATEHTTPGSGLGLPTRTWTGRTPRWFAHVGPDVHVRHAIPDRAADAVRAPRPRPRTSGPWTVAIAESAHRLQR
jgi:hypothetical protein